MWEAVLAVENFEYMYLDQRLQGYDRSENKDRLNVWELSADGLTWRSGGRFVRMFDGKGVACLLPDRSGFAIVETSRAPYRGRLYFVDEHNHVLPHGPLPSELSRFEPYDTFISGGLVKVIFEDPAVSPYDAQVDYSLSDRSVVRWAPWK